MCDNNNHCHCRRKLLAVTGEVTAGLDRWRTAVATGGDGGGNGGEGAADLATRLKGEFEGLQKAVRELQASFAKAS